MRILFYVIVTLCISLVALAALSSVATVAPGEALVVRRFGKPLSAWSEGFHIGWPWPCEQRVRVRVDQVRQFELGTGDEFINGDGNIVTLRAVVHYRVADPVAFLIHAGQSDLALRNLARHSLIAAISRTPIDAILSGGRQTLCDEVRSGIARRSQSLNLGFEVLAVSFDSAGPPAEVVPDFAAAAAARSQKEQRLVEAAAEAARLQRNATAQAEILLGAAVTEAARTRASANGEAARFAALASESAQRRDLAKMRLYLETVTALVAKVRRKVVVPSDRAVDLNLIGP